MRRKDPFGGIFRKMFKLLSLGMAVFGLLVSFILIFVSLSLPGIIKPGINGQLDMVKLEILKAKDALDNVKVSVLSAGYVSKNMSTTLTSFADTMKDASIGLSTLSSSLSSFGISYKPPDFSDFVNKTHALSGSVDKISGDINATASSIESLSQSLGEHAKELDTLKSAVDQSIDNISLALLLIGVSMLLLFSSVLFNVLSTGIGG